MYKLLINSEYVLKFENDLVISIPNDPINRDWQEYQQWLAEGNIPEPADE